MFYADLKYEPHYLRILFEYRGIADPMTTGFINKMSKYFQATSDKIIKILGHNFNSILLKLKSHLRSSKRF